MSDTLSSTELRPGDWMPNGFRALAVLDAPHYGPNVAAVVLGRAVYGSGRIQYATWAVDKTRPDTTTWGHYFTDLPDAVQDLYERARHRVPSDAVARILDTAWPAS